MYNALLDKYQSPARIDTLSATNVRKILDNLIEKKLILCQADEEGIKDQQIILRKVEQFRSSALINRLIEKNVVDSILTTKRLKAFYQRYGGEIRLRQILITSVADEKIRADIPAQAAKDAAALSWWIYQKIQSGEDFEELARQYSQDFLSASKGGDMGYLRWGRLSKQVQDVAFALDVGEVSKPVKSGFGYHIVQLLDRKKRPFEKEKSTIKYQLAAVYSRTIKNETEKYYLKLARLYKVRLHHDNFTKLAAAIGQFYAPMQSLDANIKHMILASYRKGHIKVSDLIEAVGD
ncbi:MAG: hypothetical protein D6814_04055, partial [Calditrichaeota bacterium]